jgi:hypothetical protein
VTVGEALLRLPRGRVTHPDKVYLILHGDDSPIPDWSEALMGGFTSKADASSRSWTTTSRLSMVMTR